MWVQRDVLDACRVGANRHEVLHPGGATKLSSTRSGAANAPCFLPGTNLFHLNAHVEGFGQHFDELPEVYAFVGNIVEDGLVAVALILHVAYLHLQTKILRNLSTLYHGVVFASLRLPVFLHVHLFGDAVDAFNLILRPQIGLLDLQLHQASGERHHANVVSRTGFYGHDVALFQVQPVHVVEISLSGILELNLHQVGRQVVAWDVGQPVIGVQLLVLAATRVAAKASVTPVGYLEFHIFVIHCVKVEWKNAAVTVVGGVPSRGRHSCIYCYFLMSRTIISNAMLKKTIFALAFCPMSLRAEANSSSISMTLASLMNRAKFLAKSSSSIVM